MWGYKSAEGIIKDAKSLEEARGIVSEFGFHEHIVNESHIVFRKPGKLFFIDGKKAAMELHISTHHNGLYLSLRYYEFIWFDTGELSGFLDEIAHRLGNFAKSSSVSKVPHYSTV